MRMASASAGATTRARAARRGRGQRARWWCVRGTGTSARRDDAREVGRGGEGRGRRRYGVGGGAGAAAALPADDGIVDDFLDGEGGARGLGSGRSGDGDNFEDDEREDEEEDTSQTTKRRKTKRRGRKKKNEDEEEDFDESMGVGTLTGGELKGNRTAASRHSTPRLHSHITWYENYSRMDALGKQAYNVRKDTRLHTRCTCIAWNCIALRWKHAPLVCDAERKAREN